MNDKSKITPIPTPERDEMQSEIETLRRLAPDLAESMMIFYDALIEQGFNHETAQEFVARKFLD